MDEMVFEQQEIFEGFYCIRQKNVRCFLATDGDRSLLIDSCFGGDLRGLCEHLSPKPIQLVLTHGDKDHTGCAFQFEERYMHPAEFSTYEWKNNKKAQFAPVWEGSRFAVGGFCFEVVHLPGHTPGSIALLERKKRFLIGGDHVQTGPIYMFGIGRNLSAYKASMDKLIGMQETFDTIYSSHYDLTVEKSMLYKLRDFAAQIERAELPAPMPAPALLPESVKTYEKDGAMFYLE